MIERDGFRFIVPSAIVSLVLWFLALISGNIALIVLAVLAMVATLFMLNFFRDPERTPPAGEELILSPGDGKVILLEERSGNDGKRYKLVSIFLSVFDVHVNRIPITGTVSHVRHVPGKFLKAFEPNAVTENERTEITVDSKFGAVSFSQVAGILARRIVCRINEGDKVSRGQRMGLIRFGSRVDMFLDPAIQIDIQIADRVVGGVSVIGRFPKNG